MATKEAIWTPADGGPPAGQFHAAEMKNALIAANGGGVLTHTITLTVTEGDRNVAYTAFEALVPDGSGGLVHVSVAAGSVAIPAADNANPSTDYGTLSSAGVVAVVEGTPTAETGNVVEAPMTALPAGRIMFFKVRNPTVQSNVTAADLWGRAIDVSHQWLEQLRKDFWYRRSDYARATVQKYLSAGDEEIHGVGWLKQLSTTNATSGQATVSNKRYNFVQRNSTTGISAQGIETDICYRATRNPKFRVRAPSAAGAATLTQLLGFTGDASGIAGIAVAGVEGNNFIGFRASATGNWFAVTDSGGTETATDTGVAPDGSTEHTFEISIENAGATVKFYIDGVLEATHTANIPAGLLAVIAALGHTTTGATQFYFRDPEAWQDD